MLTELLTIILLAAVPAAFSFLLDYVLGFPGKDQINHKAIGFKWTLFLAEKRLFGTDFYKDILERYKPTEALDPEAERQKHTIILLEGRKRFTWESVVGMCIYCTNFWLAVIASLVCFFYVPFVHVNHYALFLLIPIFSHLILRKI